MGLTASDIMERHVDRVSESAPLIEVHRLFVEEEIHGAPVVSDDDGRVVGVISSADLLRAVFEEHEATGSRANRLESAIEVEGTGADWSAALPPDFEDRLSVLRAADYMTTTVATVELSTPVVEVARLVRNHRIHRVLVVDAGQLAGIISTFDLAGALEKSLS